MVKALILNYAVFLKEGPLSWDDLHKHISVSSQEKN